MFVIVYNNSMILGPMRWNRYRFENEIQEECEVTFSLPDRNDTLDPIVVSEEVQILPIQGTENPEHNPKIEILHGPFWEFTGSQAVYHYEVVPMNIDAVKNNLKSVAANERRKKVSTPITITIGNAEYTFQTDEQTRFSLQQAMNSGLESFNWKLGTDSWVTLSMSDIQTVLSTITTHIQSCFDWELSKIIEIDSGSTLEELDAIQIEEQKETGVV